MPSLQDELTKKLANMKFDDEDGADAPPTNTAVPMTHQVFYHYRDNPMTTTNECADALGFERTRVAALSLQLLARKLVTRSKHKDEPYRYTTTADTMPDAVEVRKAALIKAHEMRKANAAQRRNKPKSSKKVQPKHVTKERTAPTSFNADEVVGGLSVVQARELFDKLKAIFGG